MEFIAMEVDLAPKPLLYSFPIETPYGSGLYNKSRKVSSLTKEKRLPSTTPILINLVTEQNS